jgi:hypothetical protein
MHGRVTAPWGVAAHPAALGNYGATRPGYDAQGNVYMVGDGAVQSPPSDLVGQQILGRAHGNDLRSAAPLTGIGTHGV